MPHRKLSIGARIGLFGLVIGGLLAVAAANMPWVRFAVGITSVPLRGTQGYRSYGTGGGDGQVTLVAGLIAVATGFAPLLRTARWLQYAITSAGFFMGALILVTGVYDWYDANRWLKTQPVLHWSIGEGLWLTAVAGGIVVAGSIIALYALASDDTTPSSHR